MSVPVEDLTPRQIVERLDKYIVGQDAAKRAVAIAMRNRYRRQQLPSHERDDILPKNILMIGPTGVGKTEIARRLAQLASAPFVKVEATKFTEVGYVGRDVESMIRELAAAAVRLVESEKMDAVRQEASKRVDDRLADLLMSSRPVKRRAKPQEEPVTITFPFGVSASFDDGAIDADAYRRARNKLVKELHAGSYEHEIVEIDVEESSNPFVQVFTPQGIEEMGLDMEHLGGQFAPKRTMRRTTVWQARETLLQEEAAKLMDRHSLHKEAIHRAEQTGIVFIDEIDKVAGKSGGSGPDVSREGVQRDLLPVIEGSTVATKFGPLKTDHILFIAAGAFHISRPSDLIPELQGRLPIRVELTNLAEADLRRILLEPRNALIWQYQRLLKMDGVSVEFSDDAIDEIAGYAMAINEKTENIGARRLHTLMERLLEDVLFAAPETIEKFVRFDRETVRQKLEPVLRDTNSAKFVL